MNKKILLIVGCLSGLYTIAQILQLLGIIGIGPSIAGIGITAGAAAITILCFNKALNKRK